MASMLFSKPTFSLAVPVASVVSLAAISRLSTSNLALSEGKVAFSAKEWRSFPLVQIRELTPNTSLFRFNLPSQEHEMGLSVASCIEVKAPPKEGGKPMIRPYTPTTNNDVKGYFDLIVKDYPNGKVSSYFHNLKIGDSILVKGPYDKLQYKPNMFKRIGMIAGGTGITPMLQMLKEILSNPKDKTEVHLVFANNTEDDIMQKNVLDQMAVEYHNFHVHYVVAKPRPSWKGGVGFVDLDTVERKIPAPEEGTMVFVCGPPGMMESISGDKAEDKSQGEVSGVLKERGYTSGMVYKF